MIKLKSKLNSTSPYIVLFLTILVLLYFCFTEVPKGDEGDLYFNAFKQSFLKFPSLDLSPYWPISSFYLWGIAALEHFFPTVPSLAYLLTGRMLSLFCWIAMFMISKKMNQGEFPWAATIVLFNPYLLTYATRAHPLVPGLFLFLVYWAGIQKKRKIAFVLLPLAVNFQVFIGGSIGSFFPRFPLQKDDVIRFVGIALLAACGVILTWITWGGLFPANFYDSFLYKHEHIGGSPSFGYPVTVLLLAGVSLWFTGQKTIAEIKSNLRETRIVLIAVFMGCLLLALLPDTLLGIVSIGSRQLVAPWSRFTWIFIYGIIGLGWLRVHRDHYTLLFSLLGSGILLITLPYFYERISFFATFAPCLAWSTLQRSYPPSSKFTALLILLTLLIFSAFYQFFGAL